jgi:hypothetical protein
MAVCSTAAKGQKCPVPYDYRWSVIRAADGES